MQLQPSFHQQRYDGAVGVEVTFVLCGRSVYADTITVADFQMDDVDDDVRQHHSTVRWQKDWTIIKPPSWSTSYSCVCSVVPLLWPSASPGSTPGLVMTSHRPYSHQDGFMVSRFPKEEFPTNKTNNDINPLTFRQYLLRRDVSSYLVQRAPDYEEADPFIEIRMSVSTFS